MINKIFIKKAAVFVILFFSFFMFQNDFSYANEEDALEKARLYISEGNISGAIKELTIVIDRLKKIEKKSKKIAEAYYLLARVYYDVMEDKKFEENIRIAYKLYPDLNIDESNFEIKDRVKKIKSSMNLNVKPEGKIAGEKKVAKKKIAYKKIIAQPGVKKKKKKKTLLVAVVMVVIGGAIVYLLTQNKRDPGGDPM